MPTVSSLRKEVKRQYQELGTLCQSVLTWYEKNDAAGMSNRLLKEITNALNQTTAITQKRPETIQAPAIDRERALAFIRDCVESDRAFFQSSVGWPPTIPNWPDYVEGQSLAEYLEALEIALLDDLREYENCILGGLDVPEDNEMHGLERWRPR